MKVVCCKNCGAKYQLDDDDDITTFECSSCAGDLEYLEDYSNDETKKDSPFTDTFKYDNSYIVQCQDCGLKYKIKSSDSILDYECDSCGGPLRYLDSDMNKELDKYLEERQKELKTIRQNSNAEKPTSEELTNDEADFSLKSFTDRLGNFFSEEQMQKIADDEIREQELEAEEESSKTARTTIPDEVLSKFGKEFAVPNTNDYNILKNFLKNEFFKSMSVYYPKDSESSKKSSGSFLERISIAEPDNGEVIPEKNSIHEPDIGFEMNNLDFNTIVLIVGIGIFIISIIEILLINSGIGIIAIFIGVIMLCYGLYKSRDEKQVEERTRIIREHLLTLSDDFYVFYNLRTPTSSSSINHLVVGPTGIYALLSQKYNPKLRLESENENLNLIGSTELDEDKIEEIPIDGNKRRFRYTTKQAKFSQDDKIKQKALSLGEDLINFLNDNNIKNCFVEPLVGFINNEVVVINMPLTDEDLFIEELLNKIKTSTIKLDQETIDKCAVLLSKYSADCSAEI
ncbi:NERD domain-containing protein [uncultured Methanobrevibacter sp.]|uniref:NERD domain-containing protein n=1 Tax=uncultured Methanobrevibacter sp. TaxID=253161 RepID=UPI0025DE2AE0|nr:NERD domain-containing protein [uncultured Methanobrevibacter sp.]